MCLRLRVSKAGRPDIGLGCLCRVGGDVLSVHNPLRRAPEGREGRPRAIRPELTDRSAKETGLSGLPPGTTRYLPAPAPRRRAVTERR